MNNATSQLEALSLDTRRAIYERLWFELTIAGRAVWSDPDLSTEQKLEGMKWLNEIQHRIWGAHQNPDGYAPPDLIGLIGTHVENSPYLKSLVRGSISAAIKFIVPYPFNPS
jgi:hypothetical protein